MTTYDKTTVLRAARTMGESHGEGAAGWAVDPNLTSLADARRILFGVEDGDPAVMDMAPSPLSGEWAGDPTPAGILAEVAEIDPGHEDADEILNAYEEGFSEGFWDEVTKTCQRISGRARIADAVEAASEVFWTVIADRFPEVTTGDFPPDAHARWERDIADAVATWLEGNLPGLPEDYDADDVANILGRAEVDR